MSASSTLPPLGAQLPSISPAVQQAQQTQQQQPQQPQTGITMSLWGYTPNQRAIDMVWGLR